MRVKYRVLSVALALVLLLAMGNYVAMADTSFTKTSDYINVQAYGADGDGVTDDTEAVKNAVKAAKSGQTVFFPAGFYNIKGSITVPAGVNVEGITTATCGAWQNLYDAQDKKLFAGGTTNALDREAYYGSWIFATDTSGDVDNGATFQLQGNNTIKRLGVVNLMQPPLYPDMVPTAPFIGVDINKLQSTKGIVIEDISLSNPYYGIAVYQDSLKADNTNKQLSGNPSGPIVIRNIMGGSLYRSVYVCGADGKVMIDNLQFNHTNYGGPYVSSRANNEASVELAACNDVEMSNCLLFAPWIGIKTTSAYSGSPVNLDAYNINTECERGVILEACGTQTIRNAYYLLATGYSQREEYTCVTINQPKNGQEKAVYNIENSFLQNAAGGQYYNITLQGGAEVNINSTTHWLTGSKPMLEYKHESGATSTVTVRNMAIANGNGLVAAVSGNAYKDGELRFEYCRFTGASLGKLTAANSGVKFVNCTDGAGTGTKKLSN